MADQPQDFPAGKAARSRIMAKTGLKVGANYARYLAKRTAGQDADEAKRDLHTKNAQDLFREFTKLRGTALKLAQSLSMDTGIVPGEFVEVMTQAQYSVPPMNRALVRQRIRQALGRYPEQLFASFEADAVAAASIGQVHRARTHDGRGVAVKVQYPNVRDTIASDLAIARGIAKRMVKGRNLDAHFREVEQKLLDETDYLHEGQNIEFFAELYNDDRIVTPRYLPELSAETVLTMTFVEGEHLDAFLARNPDQADIDRFGQLLWDFVHEQIASNVCTVHADVHPGNFLFREDGRLGIIDFGCVKTFPQSFRDDFLHVFRAQLDGDEALMRELYVRLEILDPETQSAAQQDQLFDFFERFGEVLLRPYRAEVFDYGEPSFKRDLNALFKEASTFNEAVGTHHFIYVNRVLVGLFGVLSMLRARIDTRHSFRLINETIDAIDRGKAA